MSEPTIPAHPLGRSLWEEVDWKATRTYASGDYLACPYCRQTWRDVSEKRRAFVEHVWSCSKRVRP